MDPAYLQQLEDSFADGRLSDDERRSLSVELRATRPLEENLRRARNRAFAIASGQLATTPAAKTTLTWLEGVLRALDAARTPVAETSHAAYFSPGMDCLNAIVQRLRAVRVRVDICVFTISDDRISTEILAAHQRGVQVRIITDNEKEFDTGSDIGQLRRAGIPLRVDRTTAHMHHKFALFDGQSLLNGSYNWTRSASAVNEENLLVTTEARLVSAFADQFQFLWSHLGD